MPPLATEDVDPTAKTIFETWIGPLPQPRGAALRSRSRDLQVPVP